MTDTNEVLLWLDDKMLISSWYMIQMLAEQLWPVMLFVMWRSWEKIIIVGSGILDCLTWDKRGLIKSGLILICTIYWKDSVFLFVSTLFFIHSFWSEPTPGLFFLTNLNLFIYFHENKWEKKLNLNISTEIIIQFAHRTLGEGGSAFNPQQLRLLPGLCLTDESHINYRSHKFIKEQIWTSLQNR